MGGLGLLHAFVRDKQLILQHATAHVHMIAEARRQAARAIQVRATGHVLHTGARGRAQAASTLRVLHNMLLNFTAQRKALALADMLHHIMYGAATRRDLCIFIIQTRTPPLPVSTAEQAHLIRVRCAHNRGLASFPATPPTHTDTLHL